MPPHERIENIVYRILMRILLCDQRTIYYTGTFFQSIGGHFHEKVDMRKILKKGCNYSMEYATTIYLVSKESYFEVL